MHVCLFDSCAEDLEQSGNFVCLESGNLAHKLLSKSFDRGSGVADLYPGSTYVAIFGNIHAHVQATGSTTSGIF